MERYGLFKKLADGTPIWVSFENDLAGATAKMRKLDHETGLEHFVHDFRSGVVIATSRSGSPQGTEAQIKRETQGV